MPLFDPVDTIAAIASPPGFGFRGIVRLSGPEALAIARVGFTPDRPEPDHVRRAVRREGRLQVDGLRPELPVSLLLWPGTRTYTGQPLAEIHSVGSPPLLQLVLAQALKAGARLAEPGEFTLRAFLSGRIDLTRAEAVLGVIDASTPAQLAAALNQLAGGLARPVASLRDRLLDVLAHLEANLDFVDEPDVDPLGRLELTRSLAEGSHELVALAERLHGRDRPEGLHRVVLVGPPNAGKSRLYNALLGRPQALVSPVPGTTRDYLSTPCSCDGLTVELVDTAGEEPATSSIEVAAQTLRAGQIEQADLLVVCVPADAPTTSPVPNLSRPTLRVQTKADLLEGRSPLADAVVTSASTGQGLEDLRASIRTALGFDRSESDFVGSTGARCRGSLHAAGLSLARAAEALDLGLGDELVSIDLREAIDELGKVVGAVVTDDVLDRIFRRFCIGK